MSEYIVGRCRVCGERVPVSGTRSIKDIRIRLDCWPARHLEENGEVCKGERDYAEMTLADYKWGDLLGWARQQRTLEQNGGPHHPLVDIIEAGRISSLSLRIPLPVWLWASSKPLPNIEGLL